MWVFSLGFRKDQVCLISFKNPLTLPPFCSGAPFFYPNYSYLIVSTGDIFFYPICASLPYFTPGSWAPGCSCSSCSGTWWLTLVTKGPPPVYQMINTIENNVYSWSNGGIDPTEDGLLRGAFILHRRGSGAVLSWWQSLSTKRPRSITTSCSKVHQTCCITDIASQAINCGNWHLQ